MSWGVQHRSVSARVSPWQRAAVLGLALSSLATAMIALFVWPRLFDGTPDGLGELVAARCASVSDEACTVSVLAISAGRFRFEASRPEADGAILDFRLPPPPARPRVLLLRAGSTTATVVVLGLDSAGSWQRIAGGDVRGKAPWRRLLRLNDPEGDVQYLRVLVQRASPTEASARLALDEVGFFASDRGLLDDPRPFLVNQRDRFIYSEVLARALVIMAGLGVITTLLVPVAVARRLAPIFALFLTLAVATLELWLVYNPYWSRDLQVALASGPLQEGVGANLNYGMHLGSRLLRGEGLTFGPGWVPWERMPGYGLLNALGGLLAGFKTDLLTIGVSTIKLHVLLLSVANALFVAAASRLMRPGAAVAVAAVICFLPNQLSYTQVDSIIVSVYLLSAAALCAFLDQSRDGTMPSLSYHLAVHFSFAFWFVMRADGLVGWAAVSLILYWRAWRYLALPVALYLMVGMSWGLYKYRYTGEFSTTTSSAGASAWGGLWQVPNKFKWKAIDESYFAWAEHLGLVWKSKQASDTALREVLRFASTYPVYVGHLMLHKFVAFVDLDVANAAVTFPRIQLESWLRGSRTWALLLVVALCVNVRHEARRTLVLSWPLFFVLPLFLILYSNGMRHLAPVTAALLAAALPPLLEPGFYRALLQRRRTTLAVTSVFVTAWFLAHSADGALLASDSWRYWTPLLDPAAFSWYLPS